LDIVSQKVRIKNYYNYYDLNKFNFNWFVYEKGKLVDLFKEVSKNADVLLIGGDLTDTGDDDQARVLAEDLKSCSIPVLAVLGNHDFEKGRQKLIRQILQNDRVFILEGEAMVIRNIGFAGVKGFGGGFDENMLAKFGEDAIKHFVEEAVNEALILDRALSRLDEENENIKKVALLHYSPITATLAGEPEAVFPFLGCSRLAEPLTRRKVVVAFHGHAHKGGFEGEAPGGVKVYNVARSILLRAGYTFPYFIYEI
jgi:Icc-related predicted phosphoesterase